MYCNISGRISACAWQEGILHQTCLPPHYAQQLLGNLCPTLSNLLIVCKVWTPIASHFKIWDLSAQEVCLAGNNMKGICYLYGFVFIMRILMCFVCLLTSPLQPVCAVSLLFLHIQHHSLGPDCHDCSHPCLLALAVLSAISLSLNLYLVKHSFLYCLCPLFCYMQHLPTPDPTETPDPSTPAFSKHPPAGSFHSGHQKCTRYCSKGTVYSFNTLRMAWGEEYLMHLEIGTEKCCDSSSSVLKYVSPPFQVATVTPTH